MEKINWGKWASVAVCVAAAGVLVWFGGRLLAVYLLPFLLAWLLSLCITPFAERIAKRLHCSPKICSILLLTAVLSAAVFLIGASVNRLLAELQGFLSRLLEEESFVGAMASGKTDYFQTVLSKFGFFDRFSATQNGAAFRERFNRMVGEALSEALAAVSAELPRAAARMISAMPSVLLFIAVTVIAGFYFCMDRRRIEESFLSFLPSAVRKKLPSWRERVKRVSFRYLRAYLLLLFLTFLELFIGFCILRVEYAFLLAVLIAVVDLLPVLGVGTVLIPWAVIELINRHTVLGAGLLILYGAVSVFHQILEPKLVGKSLGLHPLLTLAAGYVGFKLFGIVGMAAAPFAALLGKSLLCRQSPTVEK